MRFLVLGATGPCGILLVRELLLKHPSDSIIIYARSPHKLPADINNATHPTITVIKGGLTEQDAFDRALEGVDVVLSALGPAFGQPSDTPLARGYQLLIELMKKHGIKRLIALGTTSIVDPADKHSFAYSCMINVVKAGAKSAYKDIVAIGNAIRQQGHDLDWTIVRVPVLTNLNSDGQTIVAGYVGDGKVGLSLPRKAFATFVIGEVEKREWVQKTPLITTG
jgi:nucleoside-diphosphate-sugar epimerase